MMRKSEKNRTLTCNQEEIDRLSANIGYISRPANLEEISGKVISGDSLTIASNLPRNFVDLLFLDPPYNLSKKFNGRSFRRKDKSNYQKWYKRAIECLIPVLKRTATIYACSDWKTSVLVAQILDECFHVRNRITWEREKGRGAMSNWKNNTEDIWFCTFSDEYHFDVDAVKLKRKVIAPYRFNGKPKGWSEDGDGKYRLTYPSNIWTDITVPFCEVVPLFWTVR